jgi:hypothetical protein
MAIIHAMDDSWKGGARELRWCEDEAPIHDRRILQMLFVGYCISIWTSSARVIVKVLRTLVVNLVLVLHERIVCPRTKLCGPGGFCASEPIPSVHKRPETVHCSAI